MNIQKAIKSLQNKLQENTLEPTEKILSIFSRWANFKTVKVSEVKEALAEYEGML